MIEYAQYGLSPALATMYGLSVDKIPPLMPDQAIWPKEGLDSSKPIILTATIIDALTLAAAGINNAIAVSSSLGWLQQLWSAFEAAKHGIYLCLPRHDAAQQMRDDLLVRLIEFDLHEVPLPPTTTCINDVLLRGGINDVRQMVNAAKRIPVPGLLDAAEVRPVDPSKLHRIPSGFASLDKRIGGFLYGDVTLWTGKRGEGKSTVMSQVALEAIEAGERVCMYSGELDAARALYWFNAQAIGPKRMKLVVDGTTGVQLYTAPNSIINAVRDWYRGKLWIYDNRRERASEEARVMETLKLAAKRYDCRVIFIDNLTCMQLKVDHDGYYRAQARFITELTDFARRYQVHIHIAAHPRKNPAGGGKVETGDDVGGSSALVDLCANGISVSRVRDDDQMHDTELAMLKNRWEGELATIGLCYDKPSRRLYLPMSGDVNKIYGWERAWDGQQTQMQGGEKHDRRRA